MARRQDGFTYLLVLFLVALTGAGLAAISELWSSVRQREREAELLYRGDAFRQAIGRYYEASPGRDKQYPRTLDDLLKDPRYPDNRRYLRQIYTDPFSGKANWTLIAAPQGGIMGVASTSQEVPLQQTGFHRVSRVFEEKTQTLKLELRYADWEFVYVPLSGLTPGKR